MHYSGKSVLELQKQRKNSVMFRLTILNIYIYVPYHFEC